jgi:anti-sigma factor RsiW
MNPPDLRRYLAAYADGGLDPEQRAAVEAHLAANPADQAEVERWQALRRCAGRVLSGTPIPPGLADRISARLRAERPVISRSRQIYGIGLSGLAIAAMVILAVVFWPGATRVEAAGFAAVYRRCAVARRHDAFDLRHAVPDQALAELKKKAALACGVPDISQCGFHVDGACRCPPCQEVGVVHLYFRCNRDKSRVVSVFIVDRRIELCQHGSACPTCSKGERPYHSATDGDVRLICWADQDHSYVLAGPVAEPDLVKIADDLEMTRLGWVDSRFDVGLADAKLP